MHGSDFGSLEWLDGRDVTILGSGSSALDLAALLHECGTQVTVIARAQEIVFHGPPPARRSIAWRIRAPDSRIGAGWLLRICDDAPQVIHALPGVLRQSIVRDTLGPAGGYFVRNKVVGKVSLKCGRTVLSTAIRDDKVLPHAQGRDGHRETVESDHIILATGYKIDVARLPFLSCEMLKNLETINKAPCLSVILKARFQDCISSASRRCPASDR